MSNIVIPAGFGAPSKRFAAQPNVNDELGAGVNASYSVVGYRGKVWSIKHSGNEIPLMREDGDGARASIEVVIVKAAAAISKIFYANGYQDGANAAPDCWSADGLKPDASVQNKECSTCAACPRNAWGSRVTEAGKQGKQCADSRRVAVVPVNDMANEAFGGPMLLRVPAASLKDLKGYGEQLNSYGYPYYEVATRISFDVQESFPKFVFSAIKPLDEKDVKFVSELRTDKRVTQLLNEAVEQKSAPAEEAGSDVPSSPFEEPPAGKATTEAVTAATSAESSTSKKAPAAGATKTATATKAPAKTTTQTVVSEVPEDDEVTSEGNAPKSFDALLDDIL
jgi:hypothetical protein